MKIRYEFVKREIAGDTFLVPVGEAAKEYSGLIAMNGVASFLWDKLPEAENEDALTELVLGEYEVDRETAAADVAEFVAKLKEMKIL